MESLLNVQTTWKDQRISAAKSDIIWPSSPDQKNLLYPESSHLGKVAYYTKLSVNQ